MLMKLIISFLYINYEVVTADTLHQGKAAVLGQWRGSNISIV